MALRIALWLFVRDLCFRLGVVVLTGDFNKGAERELPPGVIDDQRRISPLDAASSFAAVPWSTTGVALLCGARAASLTETSGQSVVASSKCQSHRTNGSSCTTAPSTLSLLPSARRPRTKRGTTSSGCTSKFANRKPEDMRHPGTRNLGGTVDASVLRRHVG